MDSEPYGHSVLLQCRSVPNNIVVQFLKMWMYTWQELAYKDKDPFIGPQEFVMGYSKAPKQPQSSARPICHSHAMTSTGREPATIIRIAAHRSSPRYALRHRRRHRWGLKSNLIQTTSKGRTEPAPLPRQPWFDNQQNLVLALTVWQANKVYH